MGRRLLCQRWVVLWSSYWKVCPSHPCGLVVFFSGQGGTESWSVGGTGLFSPFQWRTAANTLFSALNLSLPATNQLYAWCALISTNALITEIEIVNPTGVYTLWYIPNLLVHTERNFTGVYCTKCKQCNAPLVTSCIMSEEIFIPTWLKVSLYDQVVTF